MVKRIGAQSDKGPTFINQLTRRRGRLLYSDNNNCCVIRMIASYDNKIIYYKRVSALAMTVENSKTSHIVMYLYTKCILYYIVDNII